MIDVGCPSERPLLVCAVSPEPGLLVAFEFARDECLPCFRTTHIDFGQGSEEKSVTYA